MSGASHSTHVSEASAALREGWIPPHSRLLIYCIER